MEGPAAKIIENSEGEHWKNSLSTPPLTFY
jgi:hypothetical protein